MRWARGSGWRPVTGSSSYLEATAPEFRGAEGTVSAKLALVPEVSVQFYGVAGPFLNLEPYAEAAATAVLSVDEGTPSGLDTEGKISLGLNANLGAKLSLLGRVDLFEAGFQIPIVKPYVLVRDFSRGTLAVQTEVTGHDLPDSLDVRLRPAFSDVVPPFGRDLSGSSQDVRVAANEGITLDDIRSGPSFPHRVSLPTLAGNCVADSVPATVAIASPLFMRIGGSAAETTLRIDCIPLGALTVRTVTSGREIAGTAKLALTRRDTVGSGKGTPTDTIGLTAGIAPPDTVIDGLAPAMAARGTNGDYDVELIPARRNCAVARPTRRRVTIESADTSLVEFQMACVARGHVQVMASTTDPDPAPGTTGLSYAPTVAPLDARDGPAVALPPLAANGSSSTGGFIPLYNASGATGRHQVSLSDPPNRCVQAAGSGGRPVTVFPGDTAVAAFTLTCVERLHVTVGTSGPGTDTDGYDVEVDNGDGTTLTRTLAGAGRVAVAGVRAGARVVRLVGVDPGCTTPAPVTVPVSERDSTSVTFTVHCPGPAAPNALRATAIDTTSVQLAWDAAPPSRPIAFYRLTRTPVARPSAAVTFDSITALTFRDGGLAYFTDYSYTVAAVDANGLLGPRSNAVRARTLDGTPPGAPGPLTATTQRGGAIALAWGAAIDRESGVIRYRVYRDDVLHDSSTTTSYLDAGLPPSTTYRYRVLAVNGMGMAGPLGNAVLATTTDATPPSTPSGLRTVSATTTTLVIAWSAAGDAESGIAQYIVYRDGVRVGATTTTQFSDAGLSPSTGYSYEVAAVNGAGLTGARSAPHLAATSSPPPPPPPPPPPTGDLTVTTSTTGRDVTGGSYLLEITGSGVSLTRSIGLVDSTTFTGLAPQGYTVLLNKVPPRCRVTNGTNPRQVTVTSSATVTVPFEVTCQ